MHPGAHRIIVMRLIGVYMSDKVFVGTPQHCVVMNCNTLVVLGFYMRDRCKSKNDEI